MSDIFREVDEDVRRDKAAELWDKYSIYVYGLALLIVFATAGYRAYEYWATKQAEAAGVHYETAVQLLVDGKDAEARKALEKLRNEGPSGYAMLAKFQLAAAAGKADPAAGIQAYDVLASDPGVDAVMRDSARLQAATLGLDNLPVAEVQQRLTPLAQGTGPFRNSARELLGLSAFKAKDYDNAGRWFDAIITDPSAPQGIRARADAFIGVVQSSRPQPKPAG